MTVDESILELVRRAVGEDVGAGDVTTESTIPAGHVSRGTIKAKVEGVVAGLDVARAVFFECDPELVFAARVADGDRVAPGAVTIIDRLSGPAASADTARAQPRQSTFAI